MLQILLWIQSLLDFDVMSVMSQERYLGSRKNQESSELASPAPSGACAQVYKVKDGEQPNAILEQAPGQYSQGNSNKIICFTVM